MPEQLTPAPIAGRISLIQRVAHQRRGRVTSFDAGVSQLVADEACYFGEHTLTEEPQLIDLPEFEHAILLGVKNMAGTVLRGPQSAEASDAIDRQVVLLGPENHADCLVVRPRGHMQLLWTWPGTRWYWRAATSGLITVQLFVAK